MAKYDSTKDTQEHIRNVRVFLSQIVDELIQRGEHHDESKLWSPEKEIFDEVTPELEKLTYGSKEYKAALKGMGPALVHHYANNAHHPEHHKQGIDDMTLIDILEMLADWKAATLRHADGDIAKSIQQNKGRFGITPQLAGILKNTVQALGWGAGKP